MSEHLPTHRGKPVTRRQEKRRLRQVYHEPRHINGYADESGSPETKPITMPKEPGRVRRLGQRILYRLDPAWDKDEAIALGVVGGVVGTLAAGYLLYQDAHAPKGDFEINPDFYVHMKARPHGETFEHMVMRFGKRHDRPWVERHADELADKLLNTYSDPEATLNGQHITIESVDEVLPGGTDVQMTRYLLKRYPFGKYAYSYPSEQSTGP